MNHGVLFAVKVIKVVKVAVLLEDVKHASYTALHGSHANRKCRVAAAIGTRHDKGIASEGCVESRYERA